MPEAARRPSMSAKTLANRVHLARSGKLTELGKKRKPVTDLEAENSRPQRELAEVKMERDLLKKHGERNAFDKSSAWRHISKRFS